ncbi:MAG: 5-methylcytosine-specific restriction endonuclease system specificity protein McrC [Oscillospiraceae bacterium]|nr:5-methylcytosine-specific restriction endonuclease system specificity protein McrC [Oscillospiraceae bacterium]
MTVDKGIYIKNIYYMLSYAFKTLKQKDYEKVLAEPFENVHDLFAAILAKGVSRQLKQGLYREYVPVRENLSVLRGKLDVNGTIGLKMKRSLQLACEFDEFSENNIYNQILKTTMFRLIRTKDVAAERKKELKKLFMFFGNVDLIQLDHIAWSRLTYHRNNRNYELLLNICSFIADSLLQTTEEGRYRLMSFSDENMEKLYERFILEYYKQHHPELHPSASQIKWNLTKTHDNDMKRYLPEMRTDTLLEKDGRTLIIDAKYYGKSLAYNYDKATLRSAHLYQIFAYVKNRDTDNTGNVSGLLLYAKTEGELFPDGEPFMIGNNSIGAKTLDLNREFEDIAGQLEDIIAYYFK